ncbi:MAG: signal peptidase I [Acidimicrobiales bacterium]
MTTVPAANPPDAGQPQPLFPDPSTPVPSAEPARPKGHRSRSSLSSAVEWVVVIVAAVAVALVIKTFVMQAFYIPSESMLPTLEKNDRVLVNKLSYRMHDINRGDIVVFEKPPEAGLNDGTSDLIKRVIGLPGESLVIEGGKVYIDGKQLDEPYLPAGVTTTQGARACTAADPCKVPSDAVWVMGDNRTNSRDSRWIGPITEDRIVGRAFFRIWPFSRLGGL